ncbi:MAG: response regulator transcription factor [Crocinitomicaceae bacterium]|nr:response regulator transcription factor [Crocinitomicaceae bacterium]NGF74457.1 response regulator transcription factor [Fluviicola sp. SGL-29]
MKETRIQIGIVDDNRLLIKSLITKLQSFNNILIRFIAHDGDELSDILEQNHNTDVILMDIEMTRMNGIEAAKLVKDNYPQIKIIMLTVLDNDESIFKAIQAGADGYLLKDIHAEILYSGILEVLNGGAAMTPSIALKTLKLLRNPFYDENNKQTANFRLTEREIEILEQLAKGLPNKIIADNLFISAHTVNKHIENIYTKLHVHSRLEAVIKAKENNII